jgi:phage head maturation protease
MSAPAVDYLGEPTTERLIFREEAGEAIVEGLVVPFGVWSEVNSGEGHFLESFRYGCLRESFAQRAKNRLIGLFEHGRSRLFGRAPIMEIAAPFQAIVKYESRSAETRSDARRSSVFESK